MENLPWVLQAVLSIGFAAAVVAIFNVFALTWRLSGLVLAKKEYWEHRARHMKYVADQLKTRSKA